MKQPPQHEQGTMDQVKSVFGLLFLLIHAWASTLHVFLRRPGTCGVKRFGMDAFIGWLWAGLYPIFWEGSHGQLAQGAFFLLMIPALALHRYYSTKRRRQGVINHSFSLGQSIFQFSPGEENRKKALSRECTFCMLGAVALVPFSPVLASFIFFGTFASGLQESLIQERDTRRVEAMEDALIEQQQLAERLKNRWEDQS